MKLSKITSILFIGFIFTDLFLTGCSLGPVAEKDLKNNPNVRFITPNVKEGPVFVSIIFHKEGENKFTIEHNTIGNEIILSQPMQVKYQNFYFDFLDMIAVTGQLTNGKKYTVWIDTGYGLYILTNGITIRKNDLAIFPIGKTGDGKFVGICHLPELQIGQVKFMNPHCQYLQLHWEWNVLGLPLWRQQGFVIGLRQLESFSYLMFDNINKELDFSLKKSFEPNEPANWCSYPIALEKVDSKGVSGELQLMVDIPMAGENIHIMFDTCGRYGIVTGPELWQKFSDKFENIKLRKDKFPSGFWGWLPCRKGNIPEFDICNRTIKNTDIIILDEDSPYLFGQGYISMKLFKNTVVVLDFKQKLLWVKQ